MKLCAGVLTATSFLCVTSTNAQQLAIQPRGAVDLGSSAVDQFGIPFAVTGLSGVTYVGPNGDAHRFLAVMDNSNKIVELVVRFGDDGAIVQASITGGFALAESRDFEGIAMSPRGAEYVLLSEEGTPSAREYRLGDGSFVESMVTPPVFASRRENYGFESLGASSDRRTVWTANEEALAVDGPLSTQAAGSVVRLLCYEDRAPSGQFAYATESIHGLPISGSRSGVVDIVVLPSGPLIVLERSLAFASPLFLTRMYEVGAANATDVSGISALKGTSYVAVEKRPLYAGGQTNLEGLCLGPRLASGNLSLVGVVDDADPLSVNRLAAFELFGVAECTADWDESGAVNSQDFFAFLAAFFAGEADFNFDGITNSQDFFDFLDKFFDPDC